MDTLSIREANLDDVNFQALVSAGKIWEYIPAWDSSQGRFYGWFVFAPIWALDRITNPILFQVVRLGLMAVVVALIGRLARAITDSKGVEPVWWLVWIGCLQIPPTFYGLLSYPQLHVAMILILAAALSFWGYLCRPKAASLPWLSGGLFLFGLMFNEAFLAFFLLFPALAAWRGCIGKEKIRWQACFPALLACALYCCIYGVFRLSHKPAYEGTQLGFDPRSALTYVFRYGASSLPGFELFINRNVSEPVWRTRSDIFAEISMLSPWRLLWVGAFSTACAWVFLKSEWASSRSRTLKLAAASTVLGLAFLGIPAVSQKYQAFAYRRLYPHAYNLIAASLFWLGVSIAILGLIGMTRRLSGRRRALAVLCAGALGLACLAAQITNPQSIRRIEDLCASASIEIRH